jgi:hypothetical protein
MRWLIVAVTAGGMAAGCAAPKAESPATATPEPQALPTEAKPPRVAIRKDKPVQLTRRGQAGVVSFADGKGNTVPAGATEAALDRLIDLYRAGDMQGWGGMILSGRAMMIEDGTHALLIDPGLAVHEVRLLDGRYAGRSAFMSAECLIAE